MKSIDGETATSDVIRLVGLGGSGRHGVLPEERQGGQLFTVDVTMHVDTRAAAAHDDLTRTVDYAAVANQVVRIIEGEPVNLIETLAGRIADAVLSHPGVERTEITVHKPEAPVGVPFGDVQVTIARDRSEAAAPAVENAPLPAAPVPLPAVVEPEDEPMPAASPAAAAPAAPARATGADLDAEPDEPVEVVLGLGGNVGDVRATLRRAIDDLAGSGAVELVGVAPLAKTAAVLQPDAVAQPDYLNTVVVVRTMASPRAVLALANRIEDAHGRTRGQRWGERTLDIDVLTYGSVASSDPELSLPHPRANERAFVLVPWAHLDPDAFLPGLGGGPVAALADTAPDREGVRWLALDWYEPGQPAAPAAARPEREISTSRVHRNDAASSAEQLPVARSEAASVPSPAPAPTPAPQPTPAPEPLPRPAAPPRPEPMPEPEPMPQPEPEPQPEPQPMPQPEPEPVAEPDNQPRAPWEVEQPGGATRIRPRWEPLRRDDGDR